MLKTKIFSYGFLRKLTKKGTEKGQIIQTQVMGYHKEIIMIFKYNQDGKFYGVRYTDKLNKSASNYECHEIKLITKTEEQWEWVEEMEENTMHPNVKY